MVDIVSPVDIGLFVRVESNVLEKLLTAINENLKQGIKSFDDTVSVNVDDLVAVIHSPVTNETMELIADTLSKNGWNVLKYYQGKALLEMVLIPQQIVVITE